MEDTGSAVRAGAARVLAGVLAGRSMDACLGRAETGCKNEADRALLRALAFGAVRYHRLLAALSDALLSRPLKRRDTELGALIEVGLYQLRAMRIPAYAAVGETVKAAPQLGFARARGAVNAVLRRYQREREALEAGLDQTPGVRHAYPDWLVGSLRSQWPEEWETLLAAGNKPGPMTLRVNSRYCQRDAYLRELANAGIPAEAGTYSRQAVVLDQPRPVHELPGFHAGWVTVQDEAAQLAAPLLAPEPGERVLDACAAPGGKTTHLLEYAPDSKLWALDSDPARLEKVGANLDRTGAGARTIAADAAAPAKWWDGRPFQRILLDAPCSATGVIRRHPDIKWLRRAGDIVRLAAGQARLLDALWPCLAPGGVLLYATCSLLEEENTDVVAHFLQRQPDAREIPIAAGWGQARRFGRRVAAGEGGMDGFYFVRIGKIHSHDPPRHSGPACTQL
jgi:16S rRNA (cytosine967-C5)-methyltransferase